MRTLCLVREPGRLLLIGTAGAIVCTLGNLCAREGAATTMLGGARRASSPVPVQRVQRVAWERDPAERPRVAARERTNTEGNVT
jgi:hypothetical protein